MTTSDSPLAAELRRPLADMILAAADDDMFIGHAASEWTGIGPTLEEDIAFSSIAQDEVAHAREWYAIAAELLESSRTPDDVAFGRDPTAYRCAALVIHSDDFDFSRLVARQFYYDHFDGLRMDRWSQCKHKAVAELARRIAAEEAFHIHHVDDWIRRLAHGTADGKQRMQDALTELWPEAVGLFEETAGSDQLSASGLFRPCGPMLFDEFWRDVHGVIVGAGLSMPTDTLNVNRLPAGGRRGQHGPHMQSVLDELAEVYRAEPNAAW